jgi:hypothetical protein
MPRKRHRVTALCLVAMVFLRELERNCPRLRSAKIGGPNGTPAHFGGAVREDQPAHGPSWRDIGLTG